MLESPDERIGSLKAGDLRYIRERRKEVGCRAHHFHVEVSMVLRGVSEMDVVPGWHQSLWDWWNGLETTACVVLTHPAKMLLPRRYWF